MFPKRAGCCPGLTPWYLRAWGRYCLDPGVIGWVLPEPAGTAARAWRSRHCHRAKPTTMGAPPLPHPAMHALSPTDSAFLWMETRNQPMHVAGLNIFTPPSDAGPHFCARPAD